MSSSYSTSALALLLFFLFISSLHAFNITEILQERSEFSTFNDLLSKYKIAGQINRRKTITVLAVDNGAASYLSNLSEDEAKAKLSLHVILDYYGIRKLVGLKKSTLLTTLYQTSGEAGGDNEGFINVTVLRSGDVAFGPGAPDSVLNSNLIKSVYSQPYDLSVLQVSSVIGSSNSTAPSFAPLSAPTRAPPPPEAEAPADEESPAEAPSEETSPSDAPAPSPDDSSPLEATSPTDDDSPPAADDYEEGSASGTAPGVASFMVTVFRALLMLVVR